jgi:hypothetical protein
MNLRNRTITAYRWIAIVVLLCLPVLGGLSYRAFETSAQPESPGATFSFVRYTGIQPFHLNTLPTTMYGPPWADIILKFKENMLECKDNTAAFALCYYSGPEGITPCTMDGLGLANCTCYEIPPGNPYFVDINAILNRDTYLRTVAVCGKNGERCRSAANPQGREAPVCDAVNRNTLIPGADLISTFSTYLTDKMGVGLTECPQSQYAGCMTAPCKRLKRTDPKSGLPLVQCGCPVYDGRYQVGKKIDKDQCTLRGNQVWSAAYQPLLNSQQ